jgi:signal transduction histidine kinase/ActR/RegA family two-component response regulator
MPSQRDVKDRAGSSPDFRRLFEAAPALFLVLDSDLRIIAASDAYLSATKTEREQIMGHGIFDIFPDNPGDPEATGVANLRASLRRVTLQLVPDSMAVQKYDIRKLEAEGGGFEARYWSPRNVPVLEGGRLACIIHSVEDVTEFIRLKQRGGEQEKVADEMRSKAARMEAEVFQRAQEIQEANRQLRELHAQLEKRVEERTEELQKAEGRLAQVQKLEAVGRLAAGISHDFNNLLTVVVGYSELLLAGLPENSPMTDELVAIRQAGERGAALTGQLLAFSRQQVIAPRVLDLNAVVQGLRLMLSRILGEDIETTMVLQPRLASVRADPGHIEQVLMNLIVNARDAMPRGGRLTISTSDVIIEEHSEDDPSPVPPGQYVLFAVSDNGVGMDRETQARAFEPFFTTKPQGKGSGLGLATVFGIVRQAGGFVWIYSELGVGTTIKIYLPRVVGEPDASPAFLLVDDEDQVRRVASAILRRAGYHVLEARSPGEALLVSEQFRSTIHLLVTDVVMPNMSGRELAERICGSRPGLRVLYMSGYTDDAILHHGVLDAGVSFLPKPLNTATVLRKVRAALEAPGGTSET